MSNNGSLLPLLNAALPEKAEPESETLSSQDVEQLVQTGIPNAKVIVDGAGCDLLITVVSDQFADLSLVKKQQLVMSTLTEPLGTGKLHAVSIKAFTPEEWQALSQTTAPGLLQIQL